MRKTTEMLNDIYEFLNAFVEYHIYDEVIEKEELTDAQRMALYLPFFKRFIDEQQQKSNVKIEDDVYNAVKEARESIDPLFKYCILSSSLRVCYVTDDYETALSRARRESMKGDIYSVLKIIKAKDGSYKTIKDCFYSQGDYYDSGGRASFLHFDYIRQVAEKIEKI